MNYVVAITDQSTIATYPLASDAPRGAVIFRNAEDLAAALSSKTMDSLRAKVLGNAAWPSADRESAALRLWSVLGLGIESIDLYSEKAMARAKDNFGNDKIREGGPLELIQLSWIKEKDFMVDHFVKKLPKQARQIVQMLVDDGRGLWTAEQAREVIEARAGEIQTRQGALYILSYYLSELFAKKILKRVTWAELAAKPEFAGMVVVEKK